LLVVHAMTHAPSVQAPLAALHAASLQGGGPLPPLPALPPLLLPAVAAPPLPPLLLPLLALPAALPPLFTPPLLPPAALAPPPPCPALGVPGLPPEPAVGSTSWSSTHTRVAVSQTQPLKPKEAQSASRPHCCASSCSNAEQAMAVTAKAVVSMSRAGFITLHHSSGWRPGGGDSLRLLLAAFLLTPLLWRAITVTLWSKPRPSRRSRSLA